MKGSIKVASIYMLFALIWILGSDQLVSLLSSDLAVVTALSSAKGILFVLITGFILFFLVRQELAAKNRVIDKLSEVVRIREELIRELHHRIKNNLQIVVSLLNMETDDDSFSPKAKERVVNRLLSMKSVFNVVYESMSMESISLKSVLGEYVSSISRPIKLVAAESLPNASIETVVSLLIVIDSVIDLYPRESPAYVEIVGSRIVDIYSDSAGPRPFQEKELRIIGEIAKSIDCSISEIGGQGHRLRLSF